MHEVFRRQVVYEDDLRFAEGLSEQEMTLREELLELMWAHHVDFAVPEDHIRGYVREGLEVDVRGNARPVYQMLYSYIRWDDLAEQSMKDYWVHEELSDGSEWWFNA